MPDLVDNFNDGSIDAGIWGSANTGGANAPTESGGVLNTTVTSSSSNHRSLLYSLATDFDFYATPFTVQASISSLGGTGDADSPVDRYLLIGNDNPETLSQYYPSTELNPAGVWVSIQNENGVNYVELGTVRVGVLTSDRRSFTGSLEDITLELDGQNYTVTGSGSGFSMAGGNNFSGSHTLVAGDFSSTYRFAIGAGNRQSAVTSGSVGVWDSVVVSSVPEPGTLSFFVIALGCVTLIRRRHIR